MNILPHIIYFYYGITASKQGVWQSQTPKLFLPSGKDGRKDMTPRTRLAFGVFVAHTEVCGLAAVLLREVEAFLFAWVGRRAGAAGGRLSGICPPRLAPVVGGGACVGVVS
jgi:hypothetical protein